jgi:drug/metabolite transporter (DMT)-like permease
MTTSTSINASMGTREWAMLVALSILWGGSFFFVAVVVSDLPPLTIVTLRVGLAAVTLWIVVAFMGIELPRSLRLWAAFFCMGVINNVIPFSLIVWGQTQIASGLASILNATTPLFTVVVAGFLLADERVTALKFVGVAFGFAGTVLMIGTDALEGLGNDVLAQLAILGAALSYAFAGVYGRRFKAMRVEPIVTAAGQVTASSIVLAPIALLVEQPWTLPMPGAGTWLSIVSLAVLSTAVAYVLYFRILASAGATNLLLVTFLVPVSAILLGSLALGERLELIHFLGMGLIGLGLVAIDGRLLSRPQAAPVVSHPPTRENRSI